MVILLLRDVALPEELYTYLSCHIYGIDRLFCPLNVFRTVFSSNYHNLSEISVGDSEPPSCCFQQCNRSWLRLNDAADASEIVISLCVCFCLYRAHHSEPLSCVFTFWRQLSILPWGCFDDYEKKPMWNHSNKGEIPFVNCCSEHLSLLAEKMSNTCLYVADSKPAAHW